MKIVDLGTCGIQTSYLGLGTSAAYDGAVVPAKLLVNDYPELLCFGYEQGVTFWDTSLTYGTHVAVKEALKSVPRDGVVICTKTEAVNAQNVEKSVERSLKEMDTDYIDIFLLQCLRNRFDFRYRSKALEALCRMKEKGYVRAVGISSHGLGALEACKNSAEIDIIMGRVNYSGHLMDSNQDNLKSTIAGMPAIKNMLKKIMPDQYFKTIANVVQKPIASEDDRKTALKLFKDLHEMGKSIIGMKIIGEGNLAHDINGAIKFITGLPFIKSIVLGCCSKEEIISAIKAIDSLDNN
jgi:aryl-alcohol dehydrogenase-like predicted oxidoreductase|tara:strand:- start:2658 stop:3542 length:885 start_codon:yes stop_codon:yes gene_type:complete